MASSLFSLPLLEMLMSLGSGKRQLEIKQKLVVDLVKSFVKSSSILKENTILYLAQQCPNLWEAYPRTKIYIFLCT